MEYQRAREIAIRAGRVIQPYTTKLNICGSVRRKRGTPKDIELIAIPKKETSVDKNLFGEVIKTSEIVSSEFKSAVHSLGEIIKGDADGKYIQIALPEKIKLDLFIPDDYDYYRMYAIRTGSAKYSQFVIAGGCKRIGWCGSDVGLRKISDCKQIHYKNGGHVWVCVNKRAELPPAWDSEESFFRWIGVKWIPPEFRNIQ